MAISGELVDMEEYQYEARMRMLAARGIANPEILSDDSAVQDLDQAIVRFGGRVLGTAQLHVFLQLYSCRVNHEEIVDRLIERTGRAVDLTTVQRNARRALNRMVDLAPNARELAKWG